MTRNEFLKVCVAMGAGIGIAPLLTACESLDDADAQTGPRFKGNVLIIGAGSAGLIAGHALKQHGIDFKILEASASFGGRVKKLDGFADFPIDLGAEWIHTNPSVLSELISTADIHQQIETIKYNPQTISVWDRGELKNRNFFSNFYSEFKFKNSTWYDFFAAYVTPPIADHIVFNQEVVDIDYSGEDVTVRTRDGTRFTADRVIITVPLTVLKRDLIRFLPALPENKIAALSQVDMPDGIKMFFKFSRRFYPDITLEGGLLKNLNTDDGQKTIYDVAFKKESEMNILGLFAVGNPAAAYVHQEKDQLIEYFLQELEEIFNVKAANLYEGHVVQNWTKEPFIMGSYSHYRNYDARDVLSQPLAGKLFFAGEAYAAYSELATVHGAGKSGLKAVNAVLNSGRHKRPRSHILAIRQ